MLTFNCCIMCILGVEEVNFKYYENENSAALKLKGCDTCLFSELLFKEVSVRFSVCSFKDTNELYLHMIACRERAKPERETWVCPDDVHESKIRKPRRQRSGVPGTTHFKENFGSAPCYPDAEIKRPVTLLSKWLPRVLGEGPLLKKLTLWLSMRQPVPPHVHTNRHMHALMSQMRKKHWLTSVRGKFGHKNPIR